MFVTLLKTLFQCDGRFVQKSSENECAVMSWLKRIGSAKQVFSIKWMLLVEEASSLERIPAYLSLGCSICWFSRACVTGFVSPFLLTHFLHLLVFNSVFRFYSVTLSLLPITS